MRMHRFARPGLVVMLVGVFSVAAAFAEPPNTLKVYLLAGQSNSQGHAYTHLEGGNTYNIPTLEFLLNTPAYVAQLPASTYTFKSSLDPSWINPRSDAWAMQYRSASSSLEQVEPTPTTNQGAWYSGSGPLSPGFGASNSMSTFGAELGMGIHLGNAMSTPVFIFKSNEGGTTLGNDWRPPSAVAARGGSIGPNYINTINQFKSFLNALDADLANDGKLNAYNNAVGYEVAGFVWFQGWNERYNDGPYTGAQLTAEYAQNIVDLAHDVRASDSRIPNDLPVIIPESADQDPALNTGRSAAVATLNAEKPGSAVFIENNNMIGNNWPGYSFSTSWGYHFNARAENYLEIGWRIGQYAIDNGYTGTDPAPEPATLGLLGLGAIGLLRRRRRTRA